MPDPTVRVGIAGLGRSGHVVEAYADPAAALPDVELVVAEPDAERARSLRERYSIQTYPSVAEMLEAARPPQTVAVSVPRERKAAVAVEVLAAGCNVLVDKLTGTSVGEALAVQQVARDTGGKVAIGLPYRQWLGHLLEPENGDLGLPEVGSVLGVTINWAHRAPLRADRQALTSLFPYAADFARVLMPGGTPIKAHAAHMSVERARGVIEFDTGTGLEFDLSVGPELEPTLSVVVAGERGTLYLWPPKLGAGDVRGGGMIHVAGRGQQYLDAHPTLRQCYIAQLAVATGAQLPSFTGLKPQPLAEARDGIVTAATTEALDKSAARENKVEIELPPLDAAN